MIVTTTPAVDGYRVSGYYGIVFGEVITGVNFLRDFGAGIRNIVGGRSEGYEQELLQARTEIFSQLPGMVDFLAEMPALDMALFTNKKSKSTPETSKAALEFVRPILSGMADWTEANLHDTVMAAIPESGMKNATVLWPLRIAITGRAATPGGAFEMAYLLGKDETMKRLDDAMAKL